MDEFCSANYFSLNANEKKGDHVDSSEAIFCFKHCFKILSQKHE
jgi:hypothetical protein